MDFNKCFKICSNLTVEKWQKPWINSVKAHSLAVPVLQNPSSFLIAQIGPHFIRLPPALDLFHWKAKEQESIPSTLSFNLACANTYSWPTIGSLTLQSGGKPEKYGKTVGSPRLERTEETKRQLVTPSWNSYPSLFVFAPSASLRLQAFQVSNSNNCRRIHDSVSCILWAMKLQNAQDPQCGLKKAEGGQRETNENKPQTSPAMKLKTPTSWRDELVNELAVHS